MAWIFGKQQVATQPQFRGWHPPIATGIVKKHNADGTVNVLNGMHWYNQAFVLPRGWVEKTDEKVNMQMSLPPLESPVFCLVDPKGICFVLCGWSLLKDDKYRELVKEQANESVSSRFWGKWKTLFNRKNGSLEILDEDGEKAKITIDKENKEITIVDFHENKIVIDKDKVVVTGSKDIEVTGDTIKVDAKTALEINGGGKELVTHAELKSALDTVLGMIKSHQHSAPNGANSSPGLATMQLQMDNAKASKIKVG